MTDGVYLVLGLVFSSLLQPRTERTDTLHAWPPNRCASELHQKGLIFPHRRNSTFNNRLKPLAPPSGLYQSSILALF